MAHGDRTRGNRHRQKYRKFWLNIRNANFTVGVTEQWNRLPRGAEVSIIGDIKNPAGHDYEPLLLTAR